VDISAAPIEFAKFSDDMRLCDGTDTSDGCVLALPAPVATEEVTASADTPTSEAETATIEAETPTPAAEPSDVPATNTPVP
jgi:hypothetical protein